MTRPTESNTWSILQGDAIERLCRVGLGSVHTCITSPPYWGLRDYGEAGQLGLEATPQEYVDNLVAVFRAVRRTLRETGTVWLNLGDSYAGSGPSGASYQSETTKRRAAGDGQDGAFRVSAKLAERGLTYAEKKPVAPPGLKPKDLVGIPWRVALALQADGWWLRSDIIWAKPNPMPESVTDRPTRSHEYIFLLSKSARYFYDADAIREEGQDWSTGGPGTGIKTTEHYGADNGGNSGLSVLAQRYKDARGPDGRQLGVTGESHDFRHPLGRNKRSVWNVATQPYGEAHFATFPPKLIEPCVLAGCPEGGTVLDPFAGSGTTGVVALRRNRSFVGIELNAEYVEMARQRICDDAPLLNTGIEVAA